jgi:hypothetical protein
MKYPSSILLVSLLFSGAAIAADPVKIDKPASTQAMEHGAAPHQHMVHGKAPAKGSVVFARLDANKDGKLSTAEMAGDLKAAHFSMLDTNKDGVLSAAEFAKASGM